MNLPAPSANSGPLRTSELLLQLAADPSTDDISFGEIVKNLGDRAFGPVLLIFALPMVLPMPPGISTLFGLPLTLITFQMLIGADTLWLPQFLTKRHFSRKLFRRIATKMARFLNPLEHLLKPRCNFAIEGGFEKFTALLIFTMAVIIFLPIPGFNMLPALAIVIAAVGYIERDGLVVLLGNIVALITLGLIYGSLHVIWAGFQKLWSWLMSVTFG